MIAYGNDGAWWRRRRPHRHIHSSYVLILDNIGCVAATLNNCPLFVVVCYRVEWNECTIHGECSRSRHGLLLDSATMHFQSRGQPREESSTSYKSETARNGSEGKILRIRCRAKIRVKRVEKEKEREKKNLQRGIYKFCALDSRSHDDYAWLHGCCSSAAHQWKQNNNKIEWRVRKQFMITDIYYFYCTHLRMLRTLAPSNSRQ